MGEEAVFFAVAAGGEDELGWIGQHRFEGEVISLSQAFGGAEAGEAGAAEEVGDEGLVAGHDAA